jgi:hypothetical protein
MLSFFKKEVKDFWNFLFLNLTISFAWSYCNNLNKNLVNLHSLLDPYPCRVFREGLRLGRLGRYNLKPI